MFIKNSSKLQRKKQLKFKLKSQFDLLCLLARKKGEKTKQKKGSIITIHKQIHTNRWLNINTYNKAKDIKKEMNLTSYGNFWSYQ